MVGVDGKDDLEEEEAGDTATGTVATSDSSEALAGTINLGETKLFSLLAAGPGLLLPVVVDSSSLATWLISSSLSLNKSTSVLASR